MHPGGLILTLPDVRKSPRVQKTLGVHQREGRASDWECGLKAERARRHCHSAETFHAGPPGSPLPWATGAMVASADRCARAAGALVRNHYRNEFVLLFTKQSCHQKRNKITTYHTLS